MRDRNVTKDGETGSETTIYTWFVDIAETIAERKIREAMAEGAFENLSGAGKPIDDIEEYREPGWWAARAIEEERRRHDP